MQVNYVGPTANHKIIRAQVNLTRAWALVGPGADTPLHIKLDYIYVIKLEVPR